MSLKLFVFAFVTALLMLSPAHAENGEPEALQQDAAQVVAPGPLAERLPVYRGSFGQRELQRQALRERRVEEFHKRREAMQKYYNKRLDARLTMLEKRQEQIAERHEAMRNRAQDRYNFLTRNSEDMLNKALDAQLDIANRHEELRKQAEERHRHIAAHRDAMLDMTPQERRAYMEEHASDIFGPSASSRRSSAPPRPPWMTRRSRPVPPWMDGNHDSMAR